LPYNPFDDNDNDIRKLIDYEKRNIISSDITNNAMKNELKQFGRGQGIVDKVTLIEELARLRVMNRISNKQNEDAVNNDREDKAMRLINEIDKINNNYSGILRRIYININDYTNTNIIDKEIVQELRSRRIPFDVLAPINQLTKILALARLEMLNSNSNSNTNTNKGIDTNDDDDINDEKLIVDAKQLFQNFTNLGMSTVNVTLQTITSISNDIKTKYDNTIINSNDNDNKNNDKSLFTNIVSNIGLTEVEQNAKKFLSESDSSSSSSSSSSSNVDARPKKRLILSLKELQSLEKQMKQENSFDEIVKFAKTKSR